MLDRALAGGLFDERWYRAAYEVPDHLDAWADFQHHDGAPGRDPNAMFSTSWYAARYPDAAADGLTPLADYVLRGVALGRDPGPLFATRWYLSANPDVAAAGINPLGHYLDWGVGELRDPSPVFDSVWYFASYPDAAGPGIDARAHYMREGAGLGFDPCSLFETLWYLKTYPDAALSGDNPLVHYLLIGASRGYNPGSHFNTASYAAGHKSLFADGENPLVHFLRTDRARNRTRGQAGSRSTPSQAAIVEAQMLIAAFSDTEQDLAALPDFIEGLPLVSNTPDRCMLAWRGLYLSLHEVPRHLVLVGSIDDADNLARVTEGVPGLLIVETDTDIATTAEGLPADAPWRSLAEFRPDLDALDRLRIVTALATSFQPTTLMVWGSQAGWDLVSKHGATLARGTALIAVAAATPALAQDQVLRAYLRPCLPHLTVLYCPDEQAMQHTASLFGLPAPLRDKLRSFSALTPASGFGPADGGAP